MNSIVRSWEKSQRRPKVEGPDKLVIDGELFGFAEHPKSEVKKMKNPAHKVTINFGAVHELAVHGPQDQVEGLFQETHRTLARLGITAGKAKVLGNSPRFTGGRPCIHDIVRWLDDISKDVTDVKFLKRLHNTVRARCHNDIVEAAESA